MTTMAGGWVGTGAAAESSHLHTGSREYIGNVTRPLKPQNLYSVNKATPSNSSHGGQGIQIQSRSFRKTLHIFFLEFFFRVLGQTQGRILSVFFVDKVLTTRVVTELFPTGLSSFFIPISNYEGSNYPLLFSLS